MVNKNSKKCASNNLPTRDMQNKTTLKFCLIPVRLIFIQKSRTKKDKRNISSCLFAHSTSKNGLMRSRNFPTVGDTPITQITVFIRSSATLGKQPGCENLLVVEQRSCLFRKTQKLLGGSWTGCGERGALIHCFWEWAPVKALWKPVWSLWNYCVTQMQPSRASTHELPCLLLHYPL